MFLLCPGNPYNLDLLGFNVIAVIEGVRPKSSFSTLVILLETLFLKNTKVAADLGWLHICGIFHSGRFAFISIRFLLIGNIALVA